MCIRDRSAPALSNVVLVPVASPQTVSAVHDYVKAWQNAEINIAKAKVKYENHERMTKAEKIWLHSYDILWRRSISFGMHGCQLCKKF